MLLVCASIDTYLSVHYYSDVSDSGFTGSDVVFTKGDHRAIYLGRQLFRLNPEDLCFLLIHHEVVVTHPPAHDVCGTSDKLGALRSNVSLVEHDVHLLAICK